MDTPEKIALNIFNSALQAVEPEKIFKDKLQIIGQKLLIKDGINRYFYDLNRYRNIYVVGGGKASAAMAFSLEKLLGQRITGGVVVTKYGHSEMLFENSVKIIEAAHPYPDNSGYMATLEVASILQNASEDDLVIALLSGGCSSLWALPPKQLNLDDLIQTTRLLVASGATIHQINTIRKHLSAISGGRAASLAYPAEVLVLLISDVIGDNLNTVASGPFFPDDTTFADCLEIVRYFELEEKLPRSVLEYLENGFSGLYEETPKRDAALFSKVTHQPVASNTIALSEAQRFAKECGFKTIMLNESIQGDAQTAAKVFCAFIKDVYETMSCGTLCVLAGGETTVSLGNSTGKGGRNQEFALAVALEIEGFDGITVLCCGTDGTDGPTDAAGAMVNGKTIGELKTRNLDYNNALANHDSYTLFKESGNLIITGPTYTNVMDLCIAVLNK